MNQTIEWQEPEPRPGGVIRGLFSGGPEKSEARLFWEVSRGGRDQVEVVATQRVGTCGEFEFRLPARPWSCDTHFFRLEWGVEIVDAASKPLAMATFVLSSDGRERRLIRIPEPESLATQKWAVGQRGSP